MTVLYELRFYDPADPTRDYPEWTDPATGRTLAGGPFARYVEAVEAGKPFVNWRVERRTIPSDRSKP